MRIRIFHILLLFVILLCGACSQYARIQKSSDYQKKLAFANKLYDKKKYSQAFDLYENLMKVYKGTAQFEDIDYRYSYAAFYMGDYTTAAFNFKNFVDYFPNSKLAPEMAYMQAYCFYKLSPRVELDQSNTMTAIGRMQEFVNTYPESDKVTEANKIIDECRDKLELKEYLSAQLYYNLGYYNAASVSFTNLMRDYPESGKSDQYKYMSIKAGYLYAENSIVSKQEERYGDVISAYLDFMDHYPKSKYLKEAEKYYIAAQNSLKNIQHEQDKKKPH